VQNFRIFPNSAELAVLLSRFPGTSATFGPPRRYVDTVKRLPSTSAERLFEIAPSATVKHILPKLRQWPRIQSLLEKDCGHILRQSSSIYALKNARILGSAYSHGIIGKGDFWIYNQCENYGLPAKSHPIRFNPLLPRVKRLVGTSVSLVTRHSSNYYHWMFDVIPRILKMESLRVKMDFNRYLVLDLHEPAFKMESLEYFGIDHSKVFNVRSGDHLECERILLFERPLDVPVETDTIRSIHKFIYPLKLSNHPKFVYLSRGNARTRRIENESELVTALEKLGFVCVRAEKLSFREQVEMFHSAGAIVAPHGAGLTNLIFCRPGTKVFEIFSTGYIRPDYAFISEKCGLEYFFILNGEESDVDPENFTNCSPDAMRVDVSQILETVRSGIRGGEFPDRQIAQSPQQ
jgi:hypothetical protein